MSILEKFCAFYLDKVVSSVTLILVNTSQKIAY